MLGSRVNKLFPFQVAIGFFLLASILGALMRYIYLREVVFLDYKHILHAHSHLGMLGWGFTSLAGALVLTLLEKVASIQVYRNALIGNAIAGVGMFFTFLIQGYGPVSIAFCTVHIIVVYYFAWHFLKDCHRIPGSMAVKFGKWSVYFMLISTVGLWAIAPVSVLLSKLHPLYFASIQFFLHFQFNGWFTYGILALLFHHLERNGHTVRLPVGTFAVLQASVILTYALSITWSTPENVLFYLNSAGVLLQLLAFGWLWKGLSRGGQFAFNGRSIVTWMFRVGILSLGFKVLVQAAVAIPYIAKISYTIRNFVIGFIHLTMLGAFSLTLLAILLHQKILPDTKWSLNGYRLLILGFACTEVLLFLQGILLWAKLGFIPCYFEILFIATLTLPLALTLVYSSFYKKENKLMKS